MNSVNIRIFGYFVLLGNRDYTLEKKEHMEWMRPIMSHLKIRSGKKEQGEWSFQAQFRTLITVNLFKTYGTRVGSQCDQTFKGEYLLWNSASSFRSCLNIHKDN